MEFLGSRLKYFRSRMGFSQSQLAQNICTQATISLIENRDKIPSLKIMLAICDRLNIEIQDLLVGSVADQQKAQLRQVTGAIMSGHFKQAKVALQQLNRRRLETRHLTKWYFVNLGLTDMIQDRRVDQAIFDFNQALSQRDAFPGVLDALALAGLTLAYAARSELESALAIARRLEALLDQQDQAVVQDTDLQLLSAFALGLLYFKMQKLRPARLFTNQGLQTATDKQNLLFLALFFGLHGELSPSLKTAEQDAQIALAISIVLDLDFRVMLRNVQAQKMASVS